MVKMRQFDTYDSYVRMQQITDRKKSPKTSVIRQDIADIAAALMADGVQIGRIMCHGSRNGEEVDWFAEEFDAFAWGTDLIKRVHPKVIPWDFHDQLRRWIGAFDLVYSNSLDHAHDPELALKTWAEQLAENGRLCIQWSSWSTRSVMGDCFGGSFDEYVMLLNHVGSVRDVVYHRGTVVTIVAGRK